MKNITFANGSGGKAIYLNGKLAYQSDKPLGHELVLRLLDIQYKSRWVDKEWEEEYKTFPMHLEDVKWEKR